MMYRTNIKKYLVCFTTFWRGKLNNQKYSVFLQIQTYLNQTEGQFSLTRLTFRLDCGLRYGYCEKNKELTSAYTGHTLFTICKDGPLEINA